ncbi:MAG: metal ABC transporter permease [Lachnospiraceae bacterium]|nr:metal ABC transporter permease [Lachnospiraceae bacterium]
MEGFAWLQYDFMRHAFLAILIITPLFGLMGTMIVNRKMAFFSDALGHSALTGIAIGVVLGVNDTSISMAVFAVVFALLLNFISSKVASSADTVISVFSSCSIALGLAILSQGGNFSRYSGLLVGDILSITPQEIGYLFLILLATLAFWLFAFNRLLAVSLNRTLARSLHIPAGWLENLFAALTALTVMVSIKWIGILIINALLILPAAAARNISENMREYHFFAVLFSMFSGILGLVISYYVNVATGPTIAILASIIYFATYFDRRD